MGLLRDEIRHVDTKTQKWHQVTLGIEPLSPTVKETENLKMALKLLA